MFFSQTLAREYHIKSERRENKKQEMHTLHLTASTRAIAVVKISRIVRVEIVYRVNGIRALKDSGVIADLSARQARL